MIINRFFYAPPAPVYTVSTLAPSLVAKAGSDAAASNYLSTVAAYNNGSFNGGGADNTAFNSAYTTYVSTLPGGGFGRDGADVTTGYLIWYPSINISDVSFHFTGSGVTASGSNPISIATICANDLVYFGSISAPLNGYYTFIGSSFDYLNVSAVSFGLSSKAQNTLFSSGSKINDNSYFVSVSGSSYPCSCSILLSFKIVPSDSSIVATNYPVSSRVNTIINNYATKNENNTYNYITNKPIFDENTLVFYNPLTGVSLHVTGWYYDYSTRRYVLTYTDNSVSKTATAEYGYNYITVTADGATSNYYYIA